jgi:hypothetical protein
MSELGVLVQSGQPEPERRPGRRAKGEHRDRQGHRGIYGTLLAARRMAESELGRIGAARPLRPAGDDQCCYKPESLWPGSESPASQTPRRARPRLGFSRPPARPPARATCRHGPSWAPPVSPEWARPSSSHRLSPAQCDSHVWWRWKGLPARSLSAATMV